jgi:hypothetical protein
MYEGWAIRSGSCIATFNDLLRLYASSNSAYKFKAYKTYVDSLQ